MQQILIAIFVALSILSACNTSTLSFSEIENVPDEVQKKLDTSVTLQLLHDGDKGSYIIFQATGDVEAHLETHEETITIHFTEPNAQAQTQTVKYNTFYLTTDSQHNVLDVLVNGESVAFDLVTWL